MPALPLTDLAVVPSCSRLVVEDRWQSRSMSHLKRGAHEYRPDRHGGGQASATLHPEYLGRMRMLNRSMTGQEVFPHAELFMTPMYESHCGA